MSQIDPNSLLSLGVGITAIFAVYKLGRQMLQKDFVDKAAFEKFTAEQKAHDEKQQDAINKLQDEMHTLATKASQIAVHVDWIKATLERSPLTGEHRRPDGFGS